MSTCACNSQVTSKNHTNALVTLNGLPYLLAEYLDKYSFQRIDRSLIKSEIIVDQTEAMRAIVDISIDDIGKRASDGLPNIIGNNTKQQAILDMIKCNYRQMEHQLPVLKRGIVLSVNYQLENNRTGQVIRTTTEDFRIDDRGYFLDINPRDINDNAIIVNFSNTMISTINQFTHGTDPMILRITSIQMSYECVRPNPLRPRVPNSMVSNPSGSMPTYCGAPGEEYLYHQQMQNRHMLGAPRGYGNEDVSMIAPPTWSMFNRFYHFDNEGNDIVLHGQEIYDTHTKVVRMACGSVQVNRAFAINPGHRIVFKFSIWKNDVVVVNDAAPIAMALKAALVDPYYCPNMGPDLSGTTCRPGHPINPDMEAVFGMLQSGKDMDYEQNAVINKLNATVAELSTLIKTLHGEEGGSDEEQTAPPELPERPKQPECSCPPKPAPPHEQIDMLMKMVASLQTQINELKGIHENDEDNPNYIPMPDEVISNIVENAGNQHDNQAGEGDADTSETPGTNDTNNEESEDPASPEP